MNEAAQHIVVVAVVLGSIIYLVVRARKKTGCGGGCGTSCATKLTDKTDEPPKRNN